MCRISLHENWASLKSVKFLLIFSMEAVHGDIMWAKCFVEKP